MGSQGAPLEMFFRSILHIPPVPIIVRRKCRQRLAVIGFGCQTRGETREQAAPSNRVERLWRRLTKVTCAGVKSEVIIRANVLETRAGYGLPGGDEHDDSGIACFAAVFPGAGGKTLR